MDMREEDLARHLHSHSRASAFTRARVPRPRTAANRRAASPHTLHRHSSNGIQICSGRIDSALISG